MIPAVQALRLPTAQLSAEEIAAADELEAEIEKHVGLRMERRGCDIGVTETRVNIIAEVNQRLKAAGYMTQWQPIVEKHKLNASLSQHLGFQLLLSPNDEAYRAAARADMS